MNCINWKTLIITGVILSFQACQMEEKKNPKTNTDQYEPKFTDEGDLFVLKSGGRDTTASLDIEMALTDEEKEYGMMFRKSIPKNTGMLFIMDSERTQSFWMRNTYVSLDIIFINKEFEIVSIQANATPLSERSLPSEGPAYYILEVAGNYCNENGIQKGDYISFQSERVQ